MQGHSLHGLGFCSVVAGLLGLLLVGCLQFQFHVIVPPVPHVVCGVIHYMDNRDNSTLLLIRCAPLCFVLHGCLEWGLWSLRRFAFESADVSSSGFFLFHVDATCLSGPLTL